jgi:D-glycero-beta-D-manno-heptose 1-phosphate adenylyltransferase
MRNPDIIQQKIYTLTDVLKETGRWKFLQKKISFTNGCFDILHEGHIFSLSQAAKEGDVLIVGINSDASAKRLKGASRPINNEHSRAVVIASLLMVDAVVIFEEDTPLEIITAIMPDTIVKGGDYTVEQVVGAKEVMANGGRVVINPIVQGFSTTGIIEKIHKL